MLDAWCMPQCMRMRMRHAIWFPFAKRVDGHVFPTRNDEEGMCKGAIVYLQTIQLFIL